MAYQYQGIAVACIVALCAILSMSLELALGTGLAIFRAIALTQLQIQTLQLASFQVPSQLTEFLIYQQLIAASLFFSLFAAVAGGGLAYMDFKGPMYKRAAPWILLAGLFATPLPIYHLIETTAENAGAAVWTGLVGAVFGVLGGVVLCCADVDDIWDEEDEGFKVQTYL